VRRQVTAQGQGRVQKVGVSLEQWKLGGRMASNRRSQCPDCGSAIGDGPHGVDM